MKEGNKFNKQEIEDTLCKVGLNKTELVEIYEKIGIEKDSDVDLDQFVNAFSDFIYKV